MARAEQTSLMDLLGTAGEPSPRRDRKPDVALGRVIRSARRRRRGQISLLASDANGLGGQLAEERPEYQGWQEELGQPRPVWPACRPDPGEQCGRVSCPRNLRLELVGMPGRPVEGAEPMLTLNRQAADDSDSGRRAGITVNSSDAEVEAFVNQAADLDEMHATCVNILIEQRGAMSELETAKTLGVDPEIVRRETVSAFRKIMAAAVAGGYHESWQHSTEGARRAIEHLLGKRR